MASEQPQREGLSAAATADLTHPPDQPPEVSVVQPHRTRLFLDTCKLDRVRRLYSVPLDAWERLTKVTKRAPGLRDATPVVQRYMAAAGARESNRPMAALLRAAFYADLWVRRPESWQPPAPVSLPGDLFASLAGHLFVAYPVPTFLVSTWFSPCERFAPWYIALGQGVSTRHLALARIGVTRAMLSTLLQAPADRTVEDAIRYAQALTLGGSEEMARSLLRTGMPMAGHENAESEQFWASVIRWFVRHPEVEAHEYGPIVDFVGRRRFEEWGDGTAADPGFRMAGRTANSVRRAVAAWHDELAAPEWRMAEGLVRMRWKEHHLHWSHKSRENGTDIVWRIEELTDGKSLQAEGEAMHNCVLTRASDCSARYCAIFSLTRNSHRCLTVELRLADMHIVEARGGHNRTPEPEEREVLECWARERGLVIDLG